MLDAFYLFTEDLSVELELPQIEQVLLAEYTIEQRSFVRQARGKYQWHSGAERKKESVQPPPRSPNQAIVSRTIQQSLTGKNYIQNYQTPPTILSQRNFNTYENAKSASTFYTQRNILSTVSVDKEFNLKQTQSPGVVPAGHLSGRSDSETDLQKIYSQKQYIEIAMSLLNQHKSSQKKQKVRTNSSRTSQTRGPQRGAITARNFDFKGRKQSLGGETAAGAGNQSQTIQINLHMKQLKEKYISFVRHKDTTPQGTATKGAPQFTYDSKVQVKRLKKEGAVSGDNAQNDYRSSGATLLQHREVHPYPSNSKSINIEAKKLIQEYQSRIASSHGDGSSLKQGSENEESDCNYFGRRSSVKRDKSPSISTAGFGSARNSEPHHQSYLKRNPKTRQQQTSLYQESPYNNSNENFINFPSSSTGAGVLGRKKQSLRESFGRKLSKNSEAGEVAVMPSIKYKANRNQSKDNQASSPNRRSKSPGGVPADILGRQPNNAQIYSESKRVRALNEAINRNKFN